MTDETTPEPTAEEEKPKRSRRSKEETASPPTTPLEQSQPEQTQPEQSPRSEEESSRRTAGESSGPNSGPGSQSTADLEDGKVTQGKVAHFQSSIAKTNEDGVSVLSSYLEYGDRLNLTTPPEDESDAENNPQP